MIGSEACFPVGAILVGGTIILISAVTCLVIIKSYVKSKDYKNPFMILFASGTLWATICFGLMGFYALGIGGELLAIFVAYSLGALILGGSSIIIILIALKV